MLPNKKDSRSREKPPDKPISIIPTASPDDSIIATAASGGIFVDCLNLVIPNDAKTETTSAVQSGYKLVNKPSAIPPKATCERASPNSDCLLNTRKSPTAEQLTATAIPDINARCIKLYWRISKTIFKYKPPPKWSFVSNICCQY